MTEQEKNQQRREDKIKQLKNLREGYKQLYQGATKEEELSVRLADFVLQQRIAKVQG